MYHNEERAEERAGEREAAMEAMAEEIIAEVTSWSAEHPQAKWDEIEEQVLKARQRFGAKLLQELVQKRAEVRVVPGPQCEKCGREMCYKGQKRRRVSSSVGETKIERGYYYCPECATGVFPPG
jgi:5'-deoxynucleotidase YfbR-like HD superfamily hydrolase